MVETKMARLARHPEVPIRRQLAAWIASAIRDGAVSPERSLPSVRRLAELVGVHRNTAWAAYRELERIGLVHTVPGGGVYATNTLPLSRSRQVIPQPVRRPVDGGVRVVEGGDGLRTALVAELSVRLGPNASDVCSVSPGVAIRSPEALAGTFVVARPAIYQRLAPRLIRAGAIPEPLWLRGGRAELRTLAARPQPTVVGLLTRSRRVRWYARELLAGWSGIALVAPAAREGCAVARVLRIADICFADASFASLLPAKGGRRRLLWLLRSGCVRRLQALLAGTRPRETCKQPV